MDANKDNLIQEAIALIGDVTRGFKIGGVLMKNTFLEKKIEVIIYDNSWAEINDYNHRPAKSEVVHLSLLYTRLTYIQLLDIVRNLNHSLNDSKSK